MFLVKSSLSSSVGTGQTISFRFLVDVVVIGVLAAVDFLDALLRLAGVVTVFGDGERFFFFSGEGDLFLLLFAVDFCVSIFIDRWWLGMVRERESNDYKS